MLDGTRWIERDALRSAATRAVLSAALVASLLVAAFAATSDLLDSFGRPSRNSALAQESRDWSFPYVVNDDGRGAGQSDPAVVEDAAGHVHAVWVDDRDGDGTALFYSRLNPGAERWEPNQRVALAVAGARRAFPDIAVDAFGNVHVVWLEYVSGDPEIYHSVLSATRPPWSQAKRVNDDNGPGLQWAPTVAADKYGDVHAAWVDYREGTADVYHRRRAADGAWAASSRVNDVGRGDQRAPAIAAAPTGDIFAVWLDTRDGSTQVQASRLPPGGDVWWPNALISGNASGTAMSPPSLASDDRARVHAVWGAEDASGTTLQAAVYRFGDSSSGVWTRGREVFRPGNGRVLSADVAGGPRDIAFVTWSESRPDAARVYAARLPDAGALEPARIDGAPSITNGRAPQVVVDDSPTSHVVWQGVGRARDTEIYHSRAQLERPEYPSTELEGWLEYVGRQPACGGDMYQVVSCDGARGPLVWTRLPQIDALTGSYVSVRGLVIDEGECHRVEAYDVTLRASPCPRTTGSVTGVLTAAGRPVEGAAVRVDGQEVVTGPSGRYFATELIAGPHTITATTACALTARIDDVEVPSGFQKTVPPGELLRTDVVEDCAVDLRDLMYAARSYKSRPPFYPTCVDLDMDGTVSVFDLSVIAANYGRTCPTWWRDASYVSARATEFGAEPPASSTTVGVAAPPPSSATTGADVPVPVNADGTSWSIELVDGDGIRGWDVELECDEDRLELADAYPAEPGLQPFDLADGPDGVFVVENAAADGVARLTAVVLAPASHASGDRTIARLSVHERTVGNVSDARCVLRSYVLAGDDAQTAGGRVALVRAGSPARNDRAWLPAVER